MKKIIIVLMVLLCLFCGCSSSNDKNDNTENENQVSTQKPISTFKYTHFSSGGTAEEYEAVILFEDATSVFTCYQVAFLSCTCRDSLANYYSVAYVELLNTKNTSDEASIRAITFLDNKGLWGDSNPNYYISEYTQEYMDENFVQTLVGVSKAEFDDWQGYGTWLDVVDVDAIAGATVSTSNITSMLKGLFEYHAQHYYNVSE